uniref:Uncharacterized protein n=1 Tax=Arundo donax TaxID=35708 RepID=A0A0A8Y8W9_ARUDO
MLFQRISIRKHISCFGNLGEMCILKP